jgi:hypothetical protein
VLQGGHIEGVTSVAFARDGTKMLTGSSEWTAILWDVDIGGAVGDREFR